MASLIKGKKDYLVIQFRYKGMLCREYTGRIDSRDNRRSLAAKVRSITRELKEGSFDYKARFPESTMLTRLSLVPEKPAESLTLSQQARVWLAAQELSSDTRRDYEYLFRTFLDRTDLGATALTGVTPDAIRAVVRASDSIRRSTMLLQRLRAIYSQAMDDEIAEKNPAARVRNPKRRARAKEVQPWLLDEERQAIYRAANGVDQAIVALVMGNGLRLGEALGLRRQDVDLKTRKIAITGAVYRGREKDTKNAGSTRVIDLVDTVLPAEAALARLPARIGPLFPNAVGGFIDLANWRSRRWPQILRRANLKYREPNAMRHSFAVAMLQAGHDPVHIARLMGHSSTEMIHRHYARWTLSASSSVAHSRD